MIFVEMNLTQEVNFDLVNDDDPSVFLSLFILLDDNVLTEGNVKAQLRKRNTNILQILIIFYVLIR